MITCVRSDRRQTRSLNPRALLTIVNALCLTRREQLALQATLRPLTLQLAHSRPLTRNRKMKKYTPDAPKPFPNFIVPARRHGDCLAFWTILLFPDEKRITLIFWTIWEIKKFSSVLLSCRASAFPPFNLHCATQSSRGKWGMNCFLESNFWTERRKDANN